MRVKFVVSSLFCLSLIGGAISHASAQVDDEFNSGMVLVPAGEFTMGSNHEDNVSMWKDANALNPYGFNERLYVNERPAHKVTLPAFLIDKYEVTNAQYRDFAIATQHRVPDIWVRNGYNFSNAFIAAMPLNEIRRMATDRFRLDMDVPNMSREDLMAEMAKVQAVRDKYPVIDVSWDDANDYCTWAGKRLPSEAEWEKAARGPDGNEYPWGNKWDPKKVNSMSEDPDTPYSQVGSYPGRQVRLWRLRHGLQRRRMGQRLVQPLPAHRQTRTSRITGMCRASSAAAWPVPDITIRSAWYSVPRAACICRRR